MINKGRGSFVLTILLLAWLAAIGQPALAQEGGWGAPVMISTNTASSWFSDVAVAPSGQPHIVWNSGRPTEREQMDLLMYSSLVGGAWLEPNDIAVTAYGGYTVRPAVAVDANSTLHVTFRGETIVYYTHAPADEAQSAAAWQPRRMSGSGTAYYSDIAVDVRGGLHVVWNESVSSGESERWLWFGAPQGSAIYDGIGWRTREVRAGLSNRQVYAIIEDGDGVQWFGTDDGVYRFDGYTWQKVGLFGRRVSCAAQDIDGRLWFGTDRGVSRYNGAEAGDSPWTTFSVNEGLPDNDVRAVAADRQGRVWVGTARGLVSYDGRNWLSYAYQGGPFAAPVSSIAVDAPGNVWVGTNEGVLHYNGQDWRTWTVESGLLSNVVTAVDFAQDDAIWFGTDKGVSRFDGQEWTSYGPGQGLTGGAVTALLAGSRGAIWAATEQGVSRYERQGWQTFELPPELAGQAVTVIAEDRRVNAACAACADIFYRYSTDGGQSWSLPVNLSNTFTGSVKPQVRVSSEGDVYVTWEEGEDWYARQGYPVGAMFAHSPDGGKTWRKPVAFPFARGVPQQITLGAGHGGSLVVVWRPAEENFYYYQISSDNGDSWSQPRRLPGVIAKPWEHFSLDGYDAATDSAGHVHLLVLGRLASPQENLSLLHLVWDGSAWSSPVRIYTSKDPPEWPRIDVGVGNLVYATWFTRDELHITDSERGRYKVWVAQYRANAPAQTPLPLPTPTPTPAPALEQATAASDATPTPTLALDTTGLPPGLYTESDEIERMLVALAPIAAIVLVVAGLRFSRFMRRRK